MQGPEAEGRVPFGEADAVLIGHQGAVEEVRRIPPQGSVQQDLTSGAHEEVGPTDHLGDPHGVIVDHASQLVAGHPVRAQDHEVAEIPARDPGLGPLSPVVSRHDLPVG